MSSEIEVKTLVGAVILVGVGYAKFYGSLKVLKLRRKIADIPKTKISSATMGSFVEIHGTAYAEAQDLVTSPLTERLGVGFIWEVEHYSGGKNASWRAVCTYYSSPFLYVSDGEEHLAAIDLTSADFQEDIFDKTVKFDSHSWRIPEAAKTLIAVNNIMEVEDSSLWVLSENYRIREKVFSLNEPVFIMGSVALPPTREQSSTSDPRMRFGIRSQALRTEIDEAFDQALRTHPRNAELEEEDINYLFYQTKEKLLTSFEEEKKDTYLNRTKIYFTQAISKTFVSLSTEEKVKSGLLWSGGLGLLVGPAMFISGLWLFIVTYFK